MGLRAQRRSCHWYKTPWSVSGKQLTFSLHICNHMKEWVPYFSLCITKSRSQCSFWSFSTWVQRQKYIVLASFRDLQRVQCYKSTQNAFRIYLEQSTLPSCEKHLFFTLLTTSMSLYWNNMVLFPSSWIGFKADQKYCLDIVLVCREFYLV